MNINKIDSSAPLRAERQSDVRTPVIETGQVVDSKAAVEDKVEFSSRASEVGKLVEQVKQFPDIREEKVADVRDQITAGTFNPSDETIADAILNDERY